MLKPFLPSGCLVFSLVVFGPLQVYFSNPADFPFFPLDYVIRILGPALGIAAIIGLASSRLPVPWRERVQSLVAGLALLAWFQPTFIRWRLGPLDGREIPWGEHPWATLDVLVWVAVLGIPQFVSRLRRPEPIFRISGALFVLQLGVSGLSLVATQEFRELKTYTIDDSTQFSFSKTRNGILIILDEFQSDMFAAVIGEQPQLASQFDGFTFFEDALAPASYTFPSIPAMLTGQMYDNQIPAPQFLEKTSAETSIFKFLIANGFRVDLFPWTKDTLFLSPEIASNLKPLEPRLSEFARMMDVHLFKSVPFLLKRFVLNDGEWLLQAALKGLGGNSHAYEAGSLPNFLARLEGSTADDPVPGFKYYHLIGMHVALSYNERLEYERMDYNRHNYLRQATGVAGLMARLFAELRELGIYDSSLIIIASDHGSGRSRAMWINATDPAERQFNADKARGAALLLVKTPGARGALQSSMAPVSQLDIPATIAEVLELKDAVVVGTNVFAVPVDEVRERRFFSYRWARFNPLYLAPLQEYLVTGIASRDESWRRTGRILEPARK